MTTTAGLPARAWLPEHFVDTMTLRMATREATHFPPETPTEDILGPHAGPLPAEARLPEEWRSRYEYLEQMPSSSQATLWIYESAEGGTVVVRQSAAPRRAHRMSVLELADLSHPNIITSLETPIERNGVRWEALEHCAQGSLAQLQRRLSDGDRGGWLRPLPQDQVRQVVAGIAEAIRYLAPKWIHTDIKPDNILLRDGGTAVLADFGNVVDAANPPSVHESGRTPQYFVEDSDFTLAWDWAQLGLTVVTMATGSLQPAFQLDKVRFDDLDPRISLLIAGLCTRELADRWGYSEVRRWLAGEDVPLTGVDIRERARQAGPGFVADFAGRLWDTPESLAESMTEHWPDAVRTIQGMVVAQPYLEWLADQLAASGDSRETEVRHLATLPVGDPGDRSSPVQLTHPDVLLAQVVACLNPRGTPAYGGPGPTFQLAAKGLARLAQQAEEAIRDHQSRDAVSREELPATVLQLRRLFDLHLLESFASVQTFDWLHELDLDWHDGMIQVRDRLWRASMDVHEARLDYQNRLEQSGQQQESLFEFQHGQWEDFAGVTGVDPLYTDLVRAHLLRALVDDGHLAVIHELAAAAVQEAAPTQQWYARLAGSGPVAAPLPHDLPAWAPPEPQFSPAASRPRRLWQDVVQRADTVRQRIRRSNA